MITTDDVTAWFPDQDVVLIPDPALPAAVTHPRTREVLTRVGLPEGLLDVVEIAVDLAAGPRSVADRLSGESGAEQLYVLGFIGPSYLAVHSDTGAVVRVTWSYEVTALADSLDALIETMATINTAIEGDDLAALRRLGEGADPNWRDIVDGVLANLIPS
ncbi:SUKH-4 family immunity protein [Nonomuraea sp. NBC_01738]|uniref:SUKH-4 family immunity protein n=1 Tax=Nonomuraea sp. NBC_01738 TaxID=2976003 RepID=UPI002E1410C2|nr:SUKH-4 family immunity protein [Nonomuraea sp. NBC_01738]